MWSVMPIMLLCLLQSFIQHAGQGGGVQLDLLKEDGREEGDIIIIIFSMIIIQSS
jgi:hypothetical protein